MGQQQLLLLVLCIVVVCVAVVAGVGAYTEREAKAQYRAAVSEAMRIVGGVQAWKLKPGVFGGGRLKVEEDFTGVTLETLGYEVSAAGAPYATQSGCYDLEGGSTAAVLEVYSESLNGSCAAGTQIAAVTVTGADPEDIAWSYN